MEQWINKGIRNIWINKEVYILSVISNCIAVGIGGFIGAIGRYLIGMIPVRESMLFPVKTFAINMIGCVLIALIAILLSGANEQAILLLKVGICGGFTTFSTFALESTDLIRNGHTGIAFAYMILSVVVGVTVIFLILLKETYLT